MKGFLSVYKRELKGYFCTPLAYVFLVFFLFFSSFLTFQRGFFEMRQASLRLFFDSMPLLLIFLAPAMAMRLWAEERRSNSMELLLTLPVTVTQAVLGKFFACWTVLVLAMALTWPMVATVYYLGRPDPGPIVSGYLGSILLAGAFLAIGSFFSSLTRNQVIAFVLGVVGCAALLHAASPSAMHYLAGFAPPNVVSAMESLCFRTRFEAFLRGVVELRDIVFFAVMMTGWLGANVILLNERRV